MSTPKHSATVRRPRFVPPLPLRELQAQMKIKHLSVEDVAVGASTSRDKVPYLTAHRLLKGRLVDPERMARIVAFIRRAGIPEATV